MELNYQISVGTLSHLSYYHNPPISALVSLVSSCPLHAALFGSLSSAILSTCPAHCSLLLASLSAKLLDLHSRLFLLSALSTLLFFVPSCFRTLAAFVVVVRPVPKFPFRTGMPALHLVLMTLPFSLFLRSAGPPSPPQLLSTRSLRPVLFDVPLPLLLPASTHCPSYRYTKLSPWVSFFPSSSISSSSLWWPMCRIFRLL